METIAGDTVLEQIPDSQEAGVTSVVFSIDSVVEIGHQVVCSVTTPLIVVVAVEMTAGEAVSVHTLDSQEVTVTTVVLSLDSVVEIGHQVVYSVTAPLTVVVAVETIAGEAVSVHT